MEAEFIVPDGISPLIGVRAWMGRTDGKEAWLFSCWRTIAWPTDMLQAVCLRLSGGMWGFPFMPVAMPRSHSEPAPFKSCESKCGIHALRAPPKPGAALPWPGSAIRGIARLWGHYVEGEFGWRAQYAAVAALVAEPAEPERNFFICRAALLYDVPIVETLADGLALIRER